MNEEHEAKHHNRFMMKIVNTKNTYVYKEYEVGAPDSR